MHNLLIMYRQMSSVQRVSIDQISAIQPYEIYFLLKCLLDQRYDPDSVCPDLNMDIITGIIWAIPIERHILMIGPSNSGKSELINFIAGEKLIDTSIPTKELQIYRIFNKNISYHFYDAPGTINAIVKLSREHEFRFDLILYIRNFAPFNNYYDLCIRPYITDIPSILIVTKDTEHIGLWHERNKSYVMNDCRHSKLILGPFDSKQEIGIYNNQLIWNELD